MWIDARRNNTKYTINKVLSIAIAFTFAGITLGFKRPTQSYYKNEVNWNQINCPDTDPPAGCV